MGRRDLIGLLGAVSVACALSAHAQKPAKVFLAGQYRFDERPLGAAKRSSPSHKDCGIIHRRTEYRL